MRKPTKSGVKYYGEQVIVKKSYVDFLFSELRKINNAELVNVVWLDDNETPIKIDEKTYRNFQCCGLNNTDLFYFYIDDNDPI